MINTVKKSRHRLVLVSTSGLLGAELEGLAALQAEVALRLANFALQTQRNLLRRLRLFVENRLGLSAKALLLAVVPPFTLGKVGGLAGLVLRHLVLGVLLALLAVHLLLLGSAHHVYKVY